MREEDATAAACGDVTGPVCHKAIAIDFCQTNYLILLGAHWWKRYDDAARGDVAGPILLCCVFHEDRWSQSLDQQLWYKIFNIWSSKDQSSICWDITIIMDCRWQIYPGARSKTASPHLKGFIETIGWSGCFWSNFERMHIQDSLKYC